MENTRWYVLKTRPRFERVVAAHLEKQQVDHYLPFRQIHRNMMGEGSRAIELPLLPGYVFCKCATKLPSLFMIPGVVGIMRGADSSHTMSEYEVMVLQRIVDARVPVQPWQFTRRGEVVTLENGPLSGVTGILQRRSGKRLLIFSIRLIQRSLAIEIDGYTISSGVGVLGSVA